MILFEASRSPLRVRRGLRAKDSGACLHTNFAQPPVAIAGTKVDFPNIFDGIFLYPVLFPGGLEYVLCALPWDSSDYYLFSTIQKSNNGIVFTYSSIIILSPYNMNIHNIKQLLEI